jgi:excisionase family DNA binding protein
VSTVFPFNARRSRSDESRDQLRPGAVVPLGERAVYTVKEVAYLLSLSLGNTYELLRDGTIPADRLGRRWVISRVRFHAWLDQVTVPPEPDLSATGSEATRARRNGGR